MKTTLALACVVLATSARAGIQSDDTYGTVVVGGGVAGMTAAYKLKKKDILVLEQWSEVGGRSWDGEYRGFSYARGAEYLGEPWGVLEDVIDEYRLKPIEVTYPAICHYNQDVTGYEYIDIYNGFDGIAFMHVAEDGNDSEALATYNRFMTETTELVDETYDAGEMPYSFDLDHPVASYDFVTMRQWFIDRGFGFTYQDKWNAHARGLYGASMDEVSILMAISELGWEYYEEEPIEMPDESWNQYLTDLYDEETYTFMGGLSEIPKAIAADDDLRGKVRTNSVVTEVWKPDNHYRVRYEDRVTGEEVTVTARSVVMAVPSDVALALAPTLLEGEKRDLMAQIPYCQYLTVNMISEEPIQDFTFELSTPDEFWVVAFYDSLWVQKWEEPDNPLNDEVFITSAYIAGRACADDLVSLTDAEILDRTFQDLEEIFPGAAELVIENHVNRFRHGYPLMGLGAYHNLVRLNELNSGSESSFVLVGDYMALPTMEAAMAQAEFAVARLVEEDGDDAGGDLDVRIEKHKVKVKQRGDGVQVEVKAKLRVLSGAGLLRVRELFDGRGDWSTRKVPEVKVNGRKYRWDVGVVDRAVLLDFAENGVTVEPGDKVEVKLKLANDVPGEHQARLEVYDGDRLIVADGEIDDGDDDDDDDECRDTPDYRDAQGYWCSDWVGYDCTRAVEDWGYTQAQEDDIIENCPVSCDLCEDDDDDDDDDDDTGVEVMLNPYVGVDWELWRQYKANYHTHTTQSDGSRSPGRVIDDYSAAQYDILAITDHNSITWPWSRYGRDPNVVGMVAVRGDEYSNGHHVNIYHNNFSRVSGDEYQALFQIQAVGGACQFNHPGRYSDPDDWEWYLDLYVEYDVCTGMEVINRNNVHPSDELLWDNINERLFAMERRFVYGFANDDSHGASDYFRAFQFMLMPELNDAEEFLAHTQGTSYFCIEPGGSGFAQVPRIEAIAVNNELKTIDITARDASRIVWTGPGTEQLGTGQTFDFGAMPDDSFVRARLEGDDGRCYTQPFGLQVP